MLDITKELITSVCSEEFVDAMVEVTDLLDKFGLEGYDDDLDNLVAQLDKYTNEDIRLYK